MAAAKVSPDPMACNKSYPASLNESVRHRAQAPVRQESRFTDASWKIAIDVDRDGVIGRADLIDSLWHLSVIIPIDQFDKLLEDVQLKPACIEHLLESTQNPEDLMREQRVRLEEYLEGTMPTKKWLLLLF